ncbi:MAG: hypothetical protein U9Q20_07775 [Campylobacterota bacterium]|nr:hypothetical protein [Campylobacterota bacterium]
MKNLLLVIILTLSLTASDEEISFWNDVKNSSDVELLQLYKKRYPNGIFESIADLKIKRLQKTNKIENDLETPLWLKGTTTDYKYYGVGKANKHFKGVKYQEKLAYKRALRELDDSLNKTSYSKEKKDSIKQEIQTKTYTDKNSRIYMLLYIENDTF